MKAGKRCQPPIALYLKGSLHGRDLADFESHLDGCAGCRSVLAGEQRLLDFPPEITIYRAPARLRARVLEILEQAAAGNSKGWRPYLQAVAVLLLAHYIDLI
jgi:hypothetical protein